MKTILTALIAIMLLPSGLAAQDTTGARLVVQQNGQSLVSEVRSLTIPKGASSVILPDLPATLDAQTLQVRSLTAPKDLNVLDLALDEDLLTPANLLRRHLGKQVGVVMPDGKSREGRIQKSATVLSSDEPPLFLIDGQVYAGPVEAVIYPELPAGMSTRPRLSMNVVNKGPAKQDLDLSYMAREISWRMDYVLTMNKAATSALLSGWVSLANRSGKSFDAAKVELLAGEPRSVQQFTPRALFAAEAMVAAKSLAATNADSGELFEYHLYRLKRPVSLANQQTRQVQLFESATIPVARKLLGRANAMPSGREADPVKQRLDAIISFRNTEALGLGLALPKGVLRAFQEDSGSLHFLGEAPLERTPVGSTAEMRLGQVFDVTIERVATEFERTGKNSHKVSWELTIRNAKKQPQQIVLQEQLPGKWKVASASHKWTKASSGVLEFVVDVPPSRDGEPMVLKYSFTTEQ